MAPLTGCCYKFCGIHNTTIISDFSIVLTNARVYYQSSRWLTQVLISVYLSFLCGDIHLLKWLIVCTSHRSKYPPVKWVWYCTQGGNYLRHFINGTDCIFLQIETGGIVWQMDQNLLVLVNQQMRQTFSYSINWIVRCWLSKPKGIYCPLVLDIYKELSNQIACFSWI